MLENADEVIEAEPAVSMTISGDEMVMGVDELGDSVIYSSERVPALARMIGDVVEVEKASWSVKILKSTVGLDVPFVVIVKIGVGDPS